MKEYKYDDAEENDDTFGVVEKDGKWWWEFSPVWALAGPFDTEEQAIAAGKKCQNPDGTPYIS